MSDDIVAELDRWLHAPIDQRWNVDDAEMVQHAHDEIIALRTVKGWPEPLDILSVINHERALARIEALDEAIKAVETLGNGFIAVAQIQALKDRSHE